VKKSSWKQATNAISFLFFSLMCNYPKKMVKDRVESWGSSFCSTFGCQSKREKHKERVGGAHCVQLLVVNKKEKNIKER